jgi:hypothetical protein
LFHYYMILCDTMYLTAHIDTSQHACYYSYDVVYTQYDINDIRIIYHHFFGHSITFHQ